MIRVMVVQDGLHDLRFRSSAAVRLHETRCLFFFFNDTATTEIYPLSLHDALPISPFTLIYAFLPFPAFLFGFTVYGFAAQDRKSTRLNSSHDDISYAVFCFKKKMTKEACSRVKIDAQLKDQGWETQNPNAMRFFFKFPGAPQAQHFFPTRHSPY